MPYDPSVYSGIVNAFCVEVDVILWRNPWARLRIAYRPASRPEGAALAVVDDGVDLPPGYAFASDERIPTARDKFQRNRWIDAILCRLPILPATVWS